MVFHISEFENPIFTNTGRSLLVCSSPPKKNEMPTFFSTYAGFVSPKDSTN